jgi:hypothetical protein
VLASHHGRRSRVRRHARLALEYREEHVLLEADVPPQPGAERVPDQASVLGPAGGEGDPADFLLTVRPCSTVAAEAAAVRFATGVCKNGGICETDAAWGFGPQAARSTPASTAIPAAPRTLCRLAIGSLRARRLERG